MYLRTLEKCVLKYMNTGHFLTSPRLPWQAALNQIKNSKVKSDLLSDIVMLLIIEKYIRSGIYYAICR